MSEEEREVRRKLAETAGYCWQERVEIKRAINGVPTTDTGESYLAWHDEAMAQGLERQAKHDDEKGIFKSRTPKEPWRE